MTSKLDLLLVFEPGFQKTSMNATKQFTVMTQSILHCACLSGGVPVITNYIPFLIPSPLFSNTSSLPTYSTISLSLQLG